MQKSVSPMGLMLTNVRPQTSPARSPATRAPVILFRPALGTDHPRGRVLGEQGVAICKRARRPYRHPTHPEVARMTTVVVGERVGLDERSSFCP